MILSNGAVLATSPWDDGGPRAHRGLAARPGGRQRDRRRAVRPGQPVRAAGRDDTAQAGRTTPPTWTSPASTGTSATARACTSATGASTRASRRWRTRSASACRTPRSSTARRPRPPPTRASRCGFPSPTPASRDGREVVQVYVSLPGSAVRRAPRELKAFASVPVAAGETADVDAHHRPRRPGLLGHPARPLGGGGRRVPLRRRRLLARPARHRGRRGQGRRRAGPAHHRLDARRVARRPPRRAGARPGVRRRGRRRSPARWPRSSPTRR